MAQINLLKQNNRSTDIWEKAPSIAVKLVSVVLIGLAAYYAWAWVQINSVNKQTIGVQQKIAEANNAVTKMAGKDELVTRQGQLKELATIINAHPYWSAFLPALAKVTLNNAKYTSMKLLQDGTITLQVVVPSMTDLDKYLQVFDLPEFNKNFNELKISSVSNAQVADKIQYQFGVKFKFNTALLQYNSAYPFGIK